MKSFSEQLSKYNQQHNQQKNKLMHYVGIPCIILGLFMLLNWISISLGDNNVRVPFSWLLLIFRIIYYYLLGAYKLRSITAICMIILLVIAHVLAGPSPSFFSSIVFLILFGGGLGLLLVGHKIEKSKAALMETFLQVMIAPLFLVSELLEACGLSKIIK